MGHNWGHNIIQIYNLLKIKKKKSPFKPLVQGSNPCQPTIFVDFFSHFPLLKIKNLWKKMKIFEKIACFVCEFVRGCFWLFFGAWIGAYSGARNWGTGKFRGVFVFFLWDRQRGKWGCFKNFFEGFCENFILVGLDCLGSGFLRGRGSTYYPRQSPRQRRPYWPGGKLWSG